MADYIIIRIAFWLAFIIGLAYVILIIEAVSRIVTKIQYLAGKRGKGKAPDVRPAHDAAAG